jgi:hypothetical protein
VLETASGGLERAQVDIPAQRSAAAWDSEPRELHWSWKAQVLQDDAKCCEAYFKHAKQNTSYNIHYSPLNMTACGQQHAPLL